MESWLCTSANPRTWQRVCEKEEIWEQIHSTNDPCPQQLNRKWTLAAWGHEAHKNSVQYLGDGALPCLYCTALPHCAHTTLSKYDFVVLVFTPLPPLGCKVYSYFLSSSGYSPSALIFIMNPPSWKMAISEPPLTHQENGGSGGYLLFLASGVTVSLQWGVYQSPFSCDCNTPNKMRLQWEGAYFGWQF